MMQNASNSHPHSPFCMEWAVDGWLMAFYFEPFPNIAIVILLSITFAIVEGKHR